jgi:glycerol uptake facilitator-like aquaporin
LFEIMVKDYVEAFSAFMMDFISFIPPGLSICIALSFIEGGKYFKSFRHEFFGTMLMIGATFSAGKWIGKESLRMAWTSHGLGVIAADYLGGGPHVNPAVTMSMWCLGKVSYTEAFVRVAAQLGGGLISFPLYHAISNAMDLEPFGGPEFNIPDDTKHATEAFLSEYVATMLLMFTIYILNWEMNFGTYHYLIKQSLTAIAIRSLIEGFPTAGPAMNPMLATAWDVFGVGSTFEYPSDFQHYFVYWIAPWMAAITASMLYVIYAGGTVFGVKLPIGPFKKQSPSAQTTKTTAKKTN